MNGLGHHDHRRPAAEAVRLLDRRRRLRRRGPRVLRPTSTRRDAPTLVLGARRRSRCCSCCPGSRRRSRRCSSRSSAPRSSPPRSASRPGVKTVGALPQGLPDARRSRGPSAGDVGPLLVAAVGITLVSLTDTIATVDQLRRPPRRRGRPEPGDDRHRARRTWPPGLFQGFAISTSGSRTAVAEQSGAKSQVTGLVGAGVRRAPAPVLQLAARRPAADGPRRGGDRGGDLAGRRPRAAPLRAGATRVARAVARRDRRCRVLRRAARASSIADRALDPAVLPAQLVAARRGARPGRRLRRAGTASSRSPRGREAPASLVYRWEAPLFFANAGIFRQQVRQPRPRRDARSGSCSSARRSPTSTSPRPTCSSELDNELNAAGRAHRLRRAAQPAAATSSYRYGLFETLDRDHFYPSIETALDDIARLDAQRNTRGT